MKKLKQIMIFAVLAVFLIGCSKPKSESEEKTVTQSPNQTNDEQQHKIKVVYIDWGEKNSTHLKAAKEEFEASHPNVTIQLSPVVGNTGDYNTKTSLMLQSDETIDIMFLDSFQVPSLVSAGYLAELPVNQWSDWDEHYYDNVKQGVMVDGSVYAIPISTDTRGLYYNIDVLNQAGIETPWNPKSWRDILDSVKKLHDNDVKYPLWMFASAAQGESTSIQTVEMLLSGTDDWLYQDGKWVVNSQGMLDTLSFVQELVDMGIYTSAELGQMLDRNAWQTGVELFPATKDIGIYLDGNWRGTDWETAIPEGTTEKIGITPMPKQNGDGFTSMSGGWTFAVSHLSENKNLAFEFLQVAMNCEHSMTYANLIGSMTPRKDTKDLSDYKALNTYRYTMSDYLQFTHYRPGNDYYTAVSTELQQAIESVITSQKTAEQAANDYTDNVKQLVGKGNYTE